MRGLRPRAGRRSAWFVRHLWRVIVAELDDGIRSAQGVIASLHQRPDGSYRLCLDDAASDNSARPKRWSPLSLFTFTSIDAATLREMSLSEQELASIGLNLLTRLSALGSKDA